MICSICGRLLNDFCESYLRCGHIFHTDCIAMFHEYACIDKMCVLCDKSVRHIKRVYDIYSPYYNRKTDRQNIIKYINGNIKLLKSNGTIIQMNNSKIERSTNIHNHCNHVFNSPLDTIIE